MKDISQALNFVEVLADYPELTAEDTLYKHLKAACATVNEVRKIIHTSSTHLSANKYDDATYHEVSYQIDEMRRAYDARCYEVPEGEDKPQRVLDIWVEHIEMTGLGDCPEYTMLALKKLQGLYPKLDGEIFALEKHVNLDDEDAHEFLVIGRDPNSDPEDYNTWGPAVICDAWLGEVFSVEDIPERLKCFRPFMKKNRQINQLGDFDANVHNLVLDFKVNRPVRTTGIRKEPPALNSSIFSPENKENGEKKLPRQEGVTEPQQKKQKI